jgi:hypothetical protein
LRKDGLLTARETDVAVERKLTSDSYGFPPDWGDGDSRSAAEACQHVRERLETGQSWRDRGAVIERRQENRNAWEEKPRTTLSNTTTFTC